MISIAQANALAPPLADDTVDCCVTSPPYWSLRDYGIGGQLGMERTPEEYVANMVAVFREVWRVLKPTGCLFLNLGDSYAARLGQRKETDKAGNKQMSNSGSTGTPSRHVDTLKPKDLVGIPWRVAFALQAVGWWLRSDIIWSKPNPMPESLTDRPTKAHEYIFLLTKAATYYWDQEAVREEANTAEMEYRNKIRNGKDYDVKGPYEKNFPAHYNNTSGRNIRSVWTIEEDEYLQFQQWKAERTGDQKDVWNMATQPYKGSHFATFCEELPLRCIKAGTSERGVCPECGKPWERVVENNSNWQERKKNGAGSGSLVVGHNTEHGADMSHDLYANVTTLGWRATCTHEAEPIPALVLDPFAGSGTTLRAAERLGRSGIGFDLSMQYLNENARERLNLAQGRLGI